MTDLFEHILSSELFADNPPVLLDIGAAGEMRSKWKMIAEYSICIAFDADDREMGYAVKETGNYRKLIVFNKLLTDDPNKEADFFLTKWPQCSSLLYPDHKSIDNWNFGDFFEVVKTVRMKTMRLPEALSEIGISRIDWFKTDSQGIDLRLFRSLGEDIINNVLAAEFEPGFIDGYKGEDKLAHILAYMEKRPFWLSDIKVFGTQRLSKRIIAEKFGGKIPPDMRLKTSPGWAEATFINSFDPGNGDLGIREYLLGWIFAIIEEQFGFAVEVAAGGYERFDEPFFLKLSDCARDIIMRKFGIREALRVYSEIEPKNLLSIEGMLEAASGMLEAGNVTGAFRLLGRAKSLRKQPRGIDHLRAVCFLRMEKPEEAAAALREELRYFPENIEARKLYDEIAPAKIVACRIFDAEFLELYKVIERYTMLGIERLYSLFSLAKQVCEQDIPGNFVECGVAAGGSSALLAYVINKYSKRDRFLYAFDSFEGMPMSSDKDILKGVHAEATGWGAGTCSAPEACVGSLCMELGVFNHVKTVKGYYEKTLPPLRDIVASISFMHMDADWYESMKTILNCFYDKLSGGAFVQVDDFNYWDGVKKAFDEFETANNLCLPKNDIDGCAVWFRKPNEGEK